jgi:hypothetical protein
MQAAREIATAALGRDPGPLAAVASGSHRVYLGPDVVVKIIDVTAHARLDREIALAADLPVGLAAPLLGSGVRRLGAGEVRYACYARVPGTAPGMGLPGLDRATAQRLAQSAVRWLGALHGWTPSGSAERTLRESLDHGGFTGRAALLDFEWARFGEPADDWLFLARFSGPHADVVLDVIADATATGRETLRAQCEVREAAHLASDLRSGLERPGPRAAMIADRLRALAELIDGRYWWRGQIKPG